MEIVGKDDALEVPQPQALDGLDALHLLQRHGLLDDGVLVQVGQCAVESLVLRGHHLEKKEEILQSVYIPLHEKQNRFGFKIAQSPQ